LLDVLSENDLEQTQFNAVELPRLIKMDWVGVEPTTSAMPIF
jgi:hypothetical protein